MNKFLTIILIIGFVLFNCQPHAESDKTINQPPVLTGLDVFLEDGIKDLKNKNIALVTNQSGVNKDGISNVSLFLSKDEINLIKIFSPEHGFSGKFANGEIIPNEIVADTPPIYSLYGDTRKPTSDMLFDIDMIIYDIQDVGARFYTYISTLGLVMKAAAEYNIPIIVLDRPNPIGNIVQGPVLNPAYSSFVGKYPISIRYGMTIGELALMISKEEMLSQIPELIVIEMKNYNYQYFDETTLPWSKPSPNIPDLETALIYPGICLLEATNLSEGRGTSTPFKQIGAPWIKADDLIELLTDLDLKGVEFKSTQFTPVSIPTMSKYPKYENIQCDGINISVTDRDQYNSVLTGVAILWAVNSLYPDKIEINAASLNRLWGSDRLYTMLINGNSLSDIEESYRSELSNFIKLRKKYRLYN